MISILFLSSDPMDGDRLRLGLEDRKIRDQLQRGRFRDHFNLQSRPASRLSDFTQALLDLTPRYVHFSGHGQATGELCFEDDDGLMLPLPPEALAGIFERFAHHVQCVVLNACHSEIAATAIAEGIEFVIGMNGEIADHAAIAFTVGFYQGLAAGRSVPDSYELGRALLFGIPASHFPVLIRGQRRQSQQPRGVDPATATMDPVAREAIRNGYELLRRGDDAQALAQLTKALDVAPLDPQANLYLAIAKFRGRSPKNCDGALIREVEKALLNAAKKECNRTRADALYALALVKREHYVRNHRQQYRPSFEQIRQQLSRMGPLDLDHSVLRRIRCSPESHRLLKFDCREFPTPEKRGPS